MGACSVSALMFGCLFGFETVPPVCHWMHFKRQQTTQPLGDYFQGGAASHSVHILLISMAVGEQTDYLGAKLFVYIYTFLTPRVQLARCFRCAALCLRCAEEVAFDWRMETELRVDLCFILVIVTPLANQLRFTFLFALS